jgi:hypothetical protein
MGGAEQVQRVARPLLRLLGERGEVLPGGARAAASTSASSTMAWG